ncbi:hypothetical protein B0T24DRAFT_129299 [Lasiosphaeria ovina]|uniref:DUF4470 domain-containing protein n=1 Tax=Lasiosphaeria ovina TaxID=92902 RepID=A0AAE0MXG4_9PEZI|nr:hypothetical protein B0T24DRAFT_129299 [Lasiosphaeria ovina]
MATENTETSAEAARKRGNELYKKGNLGAAEIEYKKAALLAPDDPSPLSNLSSVKFELGQYAAASEYILKALRLAGDAEADSDEVALRKKRTLRERLAKCYMHESRFGEAREILDELSDESLADSTRSTVDALAPWSKDVESHRKMVFDRLPRYQAYLDDVAEYYAIGHDVVQSLFDEALFKSCSPKDNVSLMFCGTGDARNLFMTLLVVSVFDMQSPTKQACNDIHITILDLKPAAIARTLIFFDMLIMLAHLRSRKTPGIEDGPAIMAYLFAAQVVPAAVNEKLQAHISGLISTLETDEKVFNWLFVPESTRKQVVYVLKQWQNPLQANYYSAPVIRRTVKHRLTAHRLQQITMYGQSLAKDTLPGFERDRKIFDELAILLPTKDFARRRDPPLVALIEKYDKTGSREAINQIRSHVDAAWVTNLTLIDFDHVESLIVYGENGLGEKVSTDEDKVPSIESDPLELVHMLPNNGQDEGVLDMVGGLFVSVSYGLIKLSGRLKIEALAGEMTDTMDRIRWGCLEARSRPAGGIDPSEFPRKYDRIHMSNIPDYVGGLLTAAMYGRPLLREESASNLRLTVLLNPPEFGSHEHFQAEYMMMHDKKRIADHFSIVRIVDPHAEQTSPEQDEVLSSMNLSDAGRRFMSEGYIVWEKCPVKKLSRGKDMLPRPALEKWLHALFLKICVPYPREKWTGSPVYSPLNLTAWMRLVAHLADLGYPAHWLSGVVSALCGDTITTTASFPRRLVTSPADVDATLPAHSVRISPWTAEFTTLLSIWSRLLPFGFVAPPRALAPPAELAEFAVSFPAFKDVQLRVPHFVLLFWKSPSEKYEAPPSGTALWQILREDDEGRGWAVPLEKRNKIKTECLRIFTAVTYVAATRTASFWCRKDVVQLMRDGGWKVFFWRTDTWTQVTKGVDVKDGVTMKGLWSE